MKKVLSVFLAILMLASVFACLPISASAEEYGRVPYIDVLVTAPKIGDNPVFDAFVASQYVGQIMNSNVNSIADMNNGVQWYDQTTGSYLGLNDTFVAGHTYNVGVLVTVGTVEGNQFRFKKDNPPSWCKVNGNDAQGDYLFGDSGYADNEQYYFVSYTFETLPKIINGFVDENDNVYYYKDGQKVSGWFVDGTDTYYADISGIVQFGWEKIGDFTYYLGDDGKLRVGWQKIGGGWYYFNTKEDGVEGIRRLEWLNVNGKWYFLDAETGVMQSGWKKLSGRWYYFGGADDGVLRTGWQKLNSRWYYFGGADSGAMRTGWQKVNSKWYYFGGADDGVMKSGWQKLDSKWYYFGGAEDGVLRTGWQKLGGNWYYFGGADSGAMRTGWQKVNSKWYYFGGADDGKMKTGWVKLGSVWYYFDASGVMVTGEKTINGKKYYFGNDGIYVPTTAAAYTAAYNELLRLAKLGNYKDNYKSCVYAFDTLGSGDDIMINCLEYYKDNDTLYITRIEKENGETLKTSVLVEKSWTDNMTVSFSFSNSSTAGTAKGKADKSGFSGKTVKFVSAKDTTAFTAVQYEQMMNTQAKTALKSLKAYLSSNSTVKLSDIGFVVV